MIQDLISCLNEQKSLYEFKGIDFEADLVKLYTDIRIMMAKRYENGEFGPIAARELKDDLEPTELAKEKVKLERDKKAMKQGYSRIRVKAKEIRQSYRKAITEGQRSGSGRVICDNWDQLKSIWGGSPATVTITNAVTSTENESADDEDSNEFIEQESDDEEKEEEEEKEKESEEGTGISDKGITTNPTPKFVDNKRKNMEKRLSANQRDQMYLNMAKEEVKLKQNIVNQLAAATHESNKAFEKIPQSIESVGKSIGDGLMALAGAIGGNNYPTPPSRPQQQYPQDYYYQSYATHSRSESRNTSSSSPFGSPESNNSMDLSYRHYQNL